MTKRFRWSVVVTSGGVTGITGIYRWRWRAEIEAHSKRRFWPEPKTVEICRVLL